jgi:hypothetical protein
MAQFHYEESIAPPIDVGLVEVIGEAISAQEPEVTVEEQRGHLPRLETLDADTVKGAVLTRLEPKGQYSKMLEWAAQLLPVTGSAPRRRSPLHQIMAAPRFEDAALDRLRRLDKDWILGHAEKLPPNSISIFVANARFVESFLVGANYEMARELRWRRYPTDLMGTCFARFWPMPPRSPDDIAPIPEWNEPLGRNGAANDLHPGEDVVIVVRGDLLRIYPNTMLTAIFGRTADDADGLEFIEDAGTPPVRENFLEPDITYAGLAVSADTLRAADDGGGNRWYIALTQPMDEPRFGLDEATEASTGGAPVESVNQLSWQGLPAGLIQNGTLRVSGPMPNQANWGWDNDETPAEWGPASNAGQVASILMQRPFRVLLKARDYL